eukprot:12123406-Heterocapsa_arctica.AAC.1
MHVLRSSLAAKLVGPTLAIQLGRMILSEVAELPVPLLADIDVSLGIKKDLVATLVQLHSAPAEGDAEDLLAKRRKTMPRTSED